LDSSSPYSHHSRSFVLGEGWFGWTQHGSDKHGKDDGDAAYEIPICFITSQFATSVENADKMVNLTKHAPDLLAASSVKFFAFTNLPNLLDESMGWTVILKQDLNFQRFITQSRWPKFQGYHHSTIQEHCRVVFYMDGNVVPVSTESVDAYQQEARRIINSQPQLAQKKHPNNPNPELEFFRIRDKKKDTKENTRASLRWLRSQPDYSSSCQMYVNSYFAYDVDSVAFTTTADFFWKRYSQEEDSFRDQPLWCYSLWHTHTEPLDISAGLFKVDVSRLAKGGHIYATGKQMIVDPTKVSGNNNNGEIMDGASGTNSSNNEKDTQTNEDHTNKSEGQVRQQKKKNSISTIPTKKSNINLAAAAAANLVSGYQRRRSSSGENVNHGMRAQLIQPSGTYMRRRT
jgi:hypothetical protein